MNRSKRIEFSPPQGGQLLPGPGGKGGARRNPEASFAPWIGRNLSLHDLFGSGFAGPLPGLPGRSASFCGNPHGSSAEPLARRGFLRAPPLPPGHNPRGKHEKFPEMSNFLSPPAEPGVYLNEITLSSGTQRPPQHWCLYLTLAVDPLSVDQRAQRALRPHGPKPYHPQKRGH